MRLRGASVGGLKTGPRAGQLADRLFGDVALLLVMALDGQDDEDQGERAEDERLDGVEHQLERDEGDGNERDGQRGHDTEGDLAAVDVAEEPHRQRDRLDELEHQLDEPDEERQDPGADAVAELVEREELAEIAADAERAESLELEDPEAHEGHSDGDVDVARRRAQEG